jgi:8-oxo-dGTP diphosphatase
MKDQLRLAGCILTNPAGQILLLHRNTPKRTQWEIPGGKIDPGESPEQTVVREIKEEVAVDIRIIRQLGTRDFTEDDFTMTYTWFLGEITAGTPAIGEPDTYDDLRYFTQAGLQAIQSELSGNTQNFLDAWLAGEFHLSPAS